MLAHCAASASGVSHDDPCAMTPRLRGASRPSAAPATASPSASPAWASRSSRLRILPLGFFGSASARTTYFGTLNAARRSRQKATSSSSAGVPPSRGDDDRGHGLDPVAGGDPEDGALGDGRVLVEHLLDLAAGHVLPARLDHVLLAVDDRDVALLVEGAEVARVEPAAREALGRLPGVAPVAERGVRAAVDELAQLARGDVATLVVDDARLDQERRPAGRARLADLVLRAQHGGQRRHLGLPVEVEEAHPGQALAELVEHLHRHDRGAVVALAQRAEVVRVEGGRAQQRDPDRRRAEELRRPVALDRRQQRLGLGRGQDDVRRAHA